MKVIAQTAALAEALNVTGSIVPARTPKPVLQCVKLIAADGMLTIMSTDLEAGCRYQVAAVQIEQAGEALVPAARLAGIVRESNDEESLVLETDKEACHVRGASSHFNVFGFDPAEYPAVSEFSEPADFQISANVLASMVNKTLFA
ncbi:MAG: DNA polymerase III subunit beta, partial [Planctomycetes bacterium]|nr:DNA polymerase III subunit beta [Planctomycetota bacterium]